MPRYEAPERHAPRGTSRRDLDSSALGTSVASPRSKERPFQEAYAIHLTLQVSEAIMLFRMLFQNLVALDFFVGQVPHRVVTSAAVAKPFSAMP